MLLAMLMLRSKSLCAPFHVHVYMLLAISPVYFPRNNKKEYFPFIIIRHELCFLPTHNPLMKYSTYYSGKFLHLSLFAFL